MFPTTVVFYDLDRDITTEERTVVDRELNNLEPNIANSRTVNTDILNLSGLEDLKTWIEECVKNYMFDVMRYKQKIRPYVTQSWMNLSKTGQSHHLHTHSNSLLSGVFYIDVDEEVDKINFHDVQLSQFFLEIEEPNERNSVMAWVQCKKNRLMLFPSNLAHSVSVIEKENHARTSLSFNIFVKGILGDGDNLNSLHLT